MSKIPVYKYQDALDYYAAVKPVTNVTDEQYNMHVEAIKEQGVAYYKEGGSTNIQIPGYKSEIYGFLHPSGGVNYMCFYIDSLNMSYNSFEAGLPVTIDLGKDRFGNDYATLSVSSALMYTDSNDYGAAGPSALNQDLNATIANVVPAESGSTHGKYLGMKIMIDQTIYHGTAPTEEDLKHFIENVKIKIG